ncbi:substrate-binding periplasmic protein [Alysiella filiformis]|uniref:Extracellular solute-binding protein, family 3 n=1 Tax=Alysiella filiformis DSM 16848 TaxID=1120981 RepID=A0A286E988_9NEIS|nr:transporter substrate-binding domain-containing protein [Alysiella filiformis]QMT31453.1 amino acid ABC transporter substrate-binding protein [Alysiella filiformis]UBQ55535.1 transporter substrate-binding domain-containing protein [Alysiella filiformis DSM 16848]SOD67424.1 extracellular solute-binding protein, family 3 [Alysiella filiformis DSM 16848]
MKLILKQTLRLTTLALALTACQPDAPNPTPVSASATSAAESTSSLPIVKVSSDLDYQPYIFMDGSNNPVGIEVDILNAIGKKIGVQFTFHAYAWDDIFNQLPERDIMVVASGFSKEDAELDKVSLSESYHHTPDCIATLPNTPPQQWAKGKVTVIPEDDLMEDLTDSFSVKPENFVRESSTYLGLTSLVKKQSQAFVSDCTAIRYYAHSDTLKQYAFHIQELPDSNHPDSANLVFGVRKGNDEFLGKINAALAELKKSGELEQIKRKWRQY